jgi:DNA-binding CsgD family transcriptional regulator
MSTLLSQRSLPSILPTLSDLVSRQEDLRAADNPKAVFDTYAARIGYYGFSHIFAGRLSLAVLTDLTPDPFAFANVQPGFVKDYLRKGLFVHDPVFAHARRYNRPFRWREATAKTTPAQAETVAAFAAGGLTHGLTVPVDRVGGVMGIATLGRGSDFDLSSEALIEIEILTRTLFAVIDRLRAASGAAPVGLTERERDVLSLVAEGKTNWEAGQILGVSEYSIRDYMRNLARRLQTTNRTHTVVRAMQLGLIPV